VSFNLGGPQPRYTKKGGVRLGPLLGAPVMPAAAAAAAVPIASQVLSAGVEMSKSVVAQIAAALGTPLLSYENVRVRPTKKGGTDTTVMKGGLPAWAAVAGGVALYIMLTEQGKLAERPPRESGNRFRWPWELPFP